MAAAAEYLPELAGCVCVWAGGGHLFAVDHDDGVSGVCRGEVEPLEEEGKEVGGGVGGGGE